MVYGGSPIAVPENGCAGLPSERLDVDLQVAHPELTDNLRRYLEVDGCALIFELAIMLQQLPVPQVR